MIGDVIFELKRIDSTNTYAKQLLSKGDLNEGTVIWALEQFSGRGQQNHQWISEAGMNLTFTVILKPAFLAPDLQFLLNKAVSLGVLDFIRKALNKHSNPEILIKWPNDIYAGNRKIGGILIEHIIMGSILESSLVGIGVNINQTRFPSEIPNPVSLSQILHEEMALKEALLSVCFFLDQRYLVLIMDGSDNLDHDYNTSLLGFGQLRKFTINGEEIIGKIIGVDNLGRLAIETDNAGVSHFSHGEVEIVLSD